MLRGMDAFQEIMDCKKQELKSVIVFWDAATSYLYTDKIGSTGLIQQFYTRRLNLFQKSCARSRASFKIVKPEHGLHLLGVHRVIITEAA